MRMILPVFENLKFRNLSFESLQFENLKGTDKNCLWIMEEEALSGNRRV